MAWKPEVIADASGKWCDNALRFATEDEAFRNAKDLSRRWMSVTAYRATECNDTVNYVYTASGELQAVPDVLQWPEVP